MGTENSSILPLPDTSSNEKRSRKNIAPMASILNFKFMYMNFCFHTLTQRIVIS